MDDYTLQACAEHPGVTPTSLQGTETTTALWRNAHSSAQIIKIWCPTECSFCNSPEHFTIACKWPLGKARPSGASAAQLLCLTQSCGHFHGSLQPPYTARTIYPPLIWFLFPFRSNFMPAMLICKNCSRESVWELFRWGEWRGCGQHFVLFPGTLIIYNGNKWQFFSLLL